MQINIRLKNEKYCDGCPCLNLMEGSNYYSKCGLKYEPEREVVTRGESDSPFCNHPDLIAYYRTIRPEKCIQKLSRTDIKQVTNDNIEAWAKETFITIVGQDAAIKGAKAMRDNKIR